MASIVAPELAGTPIPQRPHHARPDRGRFFVLYAWLCLAIAVAGFAPSFWYPLGVSAFNGSWLVVTHGLLFTGWAVLFLTQTRLVESGRLLNHRKWGIAGVSLATMLLLIGIATVEAQLTDRLAAGFGDKARAFTIVPLSNIALFFGMFATAVALATRPDWHKRLMMAATAVVLTPPLARFFFVLIDGRPLGPIPALTPPGTPLLALRPSSLVLMFLVGTAILDRRRLGRFHAAWGWSIGAFLLIAIARIPFAQTEAWRGFADWLVAFD